MRFDATSTRHQDLPQGPQTPTEYSQGISLTSLVVSLFEQSLVRGLCRLPSGKPVAFRLVAKPLIFRFSIKCPAERMSLSARRAAEPGFPKIKL